MLTIVSVPPKKLHYFFFWIWMVLEGINGITTLGINGARSCIIYENDIDVFGNFLHLNEQIQEFNNKNGAVAARALPGRVSIRGDLISPLSNVWIEVLRVQAKIRNHVEDEGLGCITSDRIKIQSSVGQEVENETNFRVMVATFRYTMQNWDSYDTVPKVVQFMNTFDESTCAEKTSFIRSLSGFHPQWIFIRPWTILTESIEDVEEVFDLLSTLVILPIRFDIEFSRSNTNKFVKSVLEKVIDNSNNVNSLSGYSRFPGVFNKLIITQDNFHVLRPLLSSSFTFKNLFIHHMGNTEVSISCKAKKMTVRGNCRVVRFPNGLQDLTYMDAAEIDTTHFPEHIKTLMLKDCAMTGALVNRVSNVIRSDRVEYGGLRLFELKSTLPTPNLEYSEAINRLLFLLCQKGVKEVRIYPLS